MTATTTQRPANTNILAAAPLIFIPFAAMLFYALGGGAGTGQEAEAATPKGLNTFLPSPRLKDKSQDKLSLYQADDKDSMNRKNQDKLSLSLFDRTGQQTAVDGEGLGDDPMMPDEEGRVAEPFANSRERINRRLGSTRERGSRRREPVDELEQKLSALQRTLAEAEQQPDGPDRPTTAAAAGPDDAVLKQLETAMAAIQQNAASAQGDPELNMMNGMLDKVLDIQHPGRVKDRMDKNKTVASKGMRVAPVAAVNRVDTILSASRPVGDASPLSVTTRPATSNGFYELSQGSGDGQVIAPAISAVVHETQTLVTGSTLKIRLEQDVYVQNQRIPKGTFIYGRCAMSGERLQITFTAIRHGQLLFPVDLVAYALDGIPGVRIPGSMTRDAAKQGTNDALQAISMGSLNPSIEAQATAAGIDAAKTLLTRKVKLVRVTIKSDYPLLLKDGTTAQP